MGRNTLRSLVMNYKRSEGKYYKDNPEAVWKRDQTKMWVNGKYISKLNPLHKPGRYRCTAAQTKEFCA